MYGKLHQIYSDFFTYNYCSNCNTWKFFGLKLLAMTTLTNLMPFDFSKLIFATFLGVIFFNEKIDLITIFCGSGIIICNSLIAKKISNEKE